ncbi:methyltransferase [Rhodococcus sp. IEGM 1318]|uniref:methyltransferase n=1 Tax=Rhodococcus sp. IEGM 1318 TaxID=3082226 RepID=UPI0029555DB1|nr:methyltransferase [Rhodococcus sp. IEGM 1318]MDV8009551.1 methyltransferase [Rhodococcus sp. IEGM 1318]
MSALTETLRGAGCVFAEDEAEIIWNSTSNFQELESWTHRRIAGEPLEQIVGWVQFAELRLRVGPGVFVPRQRTLLLADATADLVEAIDNPVVLVAFCGVAPVAATVLDRHPRANVHVTDSNSTALSYAQANADFRAATYQGDVLSGLAVELRHKVEVIAAVPPYVPDSEARFLPREAIDF